MQRCFGCQVKSTHIVLADPNYVQAHLLRGVALPAVARDEWNPDSGSSLEDHQRSDGSDGTHSRRKLALTVRIDIS